MRVGCLTHGNKPNVYTNPENRDAVVSIGNQIYRIMNRQNTFFLLAFWIVAHISPAQIPENPEDISPLLISEKIPPVNIRTLEGASIPMTDILKQNSSVILFYRGGWCPFCNAHLSAVGEIQEEIKDLGYQIIAISPDAPEQLKETTRKQELDYLLFSDASGELIQAMGIAFRAPERYEKRLSNYSEGDNPGLLPVPSLFVADTRGTILFEYVNPDYKHRISPELLLSVLKILED